MLKLISRPFSLPLRTGSVHGAPGRIQLLLTGGFLAVMTDPGVERALRTICSVAVTSDLPGGMGNWMDPRHMDKFGVNFYRSWFLTALLVAVVLSIA